MSIAIIGAGASGLMAAIIAAKRGLSVIVFETQGEVGKKILASGNGSCNITNTNLSSKHYSNTFVDYALKSFGFKEFEKFCLQIALPLLVKPDGRCYPQTLEARSVRDALLRSATGLGVEIRLSSKVDKILQRRGYFELICNNKTHKASKIIIATGLCAAPQLGGTDSGLSLAKTLKHSTVTTSAALVGLHTSCKELYRASGVKVDARLSLHVDREIVQNIRGDLLFTKYGISGFATLDISAKASSALEQQRDVELEIELLPGIERSSLEKLLTRIYKDLPDLTTQELLQTVLPRKLSAAFVRSNSALESKKANIAKLVDTLKCWRVKITQTHGFKHAEVCNGGVETDEIDPKTMESKIVKNLFFTGEVLDITGERGGYNFAFAWASGYLAGRSV